MVDEVASLALFAREETIRFAAGRARKPVPVLLVIGALGAGKTALLNNILHNKLNLRVTCLVNDLAALNIDADVLVSRDSHRTVRLSNGCACHSLIGRLEDAVWSVLEETDGTDCVDYIVVETSGVVADPLSVVTSLERRHGKMTRARLDGVVLVVDTDLLVHQLQTCTAPDDVIGGAAAEDEIARRRLIAAGGEALWTQLQTADVLLLNKIDLLERDDNAYGSESNGSGAETSTKVASALSDLHSLLQAAAPWVRIHECAQGQLPLPLLLNVELCGDRASEGAPGHEARLVAQAGGFVTRSARHAKSARRALPSSSSVVTARPSVPGSPTAAVGMAAVSQPVVPEWAASGYAAAQGASHGYSSIEFESDAPLRLSAFQDMLAAVGYPRGCGDTSERGVSPRYVGLLERVQRVKGVVWFAECRAERWLFQLAGRQRVTLVHDGPWQGRPSVQLVAIGQHWHDDGKRLQATLQSMRAVQSDEHVRVAMEVTAPGEATADTPAGATASAMAGACDECEDAPEDAGRDDAAEAERVHERLRADARFEVFAAEEASDAALESRSTKRPRPSHREEGAPPPTVDFTAGKCTGSSSPAVVHFQLVGAALCGLTRREFERTHGVDVNELNATFVQQLNAALVAEMAPALRLPKPTDGRTDGDSPARGSWQAKACLTGAPITATATGALPSTSAARASAPPFTVRFAVGGVCRFEHVWPVISLVAESLLNRTFERLKLCRCDH